MKKRNWAGLKHSARSHDASRLIIPLRPRNRSLGTTKQGAGCGAVGGAEADTLAPGPDAERRVGLLDSAGVVNGQNSIDGLKKAPILNHKLNGTEISAVRQLITGYRESAAFLLRSADELEHLIQIQTKL